MARPTPLHGKVLNQRGNGKEAVAFLCDHGVGQIVAMMGILKAGKFYVPLEPSFPENLNERIFNSAQCRLLIHDKENFPAACRLAPSESNLLELESFSVAKSSGNPEIRISPDDFSCIYYTSGSTGEPKGVIQNHRNVLHFMRTIGSDWPITGEDRMVHLVPCCFSGTVLPVFGSLLNGAMVVPCDIRKEGITGLTNLLEKEQISLYFSVPSLFRSVVDAFDKAIDLPQLRMIVQGGEAVNSSDIELYKRNFSEHGVLCHILASAEAYYTRCYKVDKATECEGLTVPVGFAVDGKSICLLDENGEEVHDGEIGEIAIKSRYLSPGYWQNPERTQAVFVDDPEGGKERTYLSGDIGRMTPEGCLTHLGRKDAMVKIRGQRLEITSIENALLELENVREAAVVVCRNESGREPYLAAYLVCNTRPAPDVTFLREKLCKNLPEFMIPAMFIFMDDLPRNANGKVDRPKLPPPSERRSHTDTPLIAPRNDLEAQLAAMCEKMFRTHPVGVKDSFQEMGMDSISYLHFLSKLEQQFPQVASAGDRIRFAENIEHLGKILRKEETGSFSAGDSKVADFSDSCSSKLGGRRRK